MIYGTHNSATGGELLTWLKPLAWVINPTSKCQGKTITDQELNEYFNYCEECKKIAKM